MTTRRRHIGMAVTGLLVLAGLMLAGAPVAWAQVPKGLEFQVNSYTTSYQSYPSASVVGTAGGFVVAWQSNG
jgi:hypothetical protein